MSAYLSTFPGAHTLAIPESAAKLSPRELAQQYGAAYAVDGDLAKAGGKTRVAVRLTDAGTGESLWSDHYDFEGSDRFAMQSETARKIYSALGGSFGKIGKAEVEKAWRKSDRDVDEDGIYDPRHPNDRLLLGMKGTMSELELSLFRQRSQEALQRFQPALKAMGVDPFERLVINPRRPRIRATTAIGFKQDVLATDLVPKGVKRKAGSALAFVCSEVCSFSTVSDGVRKLVVNRRAVSPSLAWVGSGFLPSAGVTRPQR